ncbi:unnamed protein product [Cyprideis torosa]|uniref:Metalloprotease TIKI homolog n=1 Tax=Cyprideis torosa TaxID=163714 RepID=A0A7R8WIH3_9CRUS|nr:unnamed protein product [Cyprideis torosa]CAG0900753.1 unnamed protein product [Cyprideis torosa]
MMFFRPCLSVALRLSSIDCDKTWAQMDSDHDSTMQFQEAGRMGKSTGAVERVHEQCLPLNRLGLPQVMFALNSTLRYQERLENDGKNVPLDEEESNEFTEQLIRHYNCRDLDATLFSRDTAQVHLVSETEAERRKAEEIESYFWKELILNRNMRMGDRVVKIVRSNPDRSLFFAFGAGHFLGNYTVLDVIRTQGLEVTEVGPNEEIVPPTIPRPVKTSTGPVGPIHSPSDTRGSGSSFRGPVCYSYPCENQQRLLQEKLTAIRHPLLEFPRPTVRTFHDLWIREQSSDHSPRFGLQSSIPFGSLTAASTPTLYLGQNYFFLLLILFLLRVLFPSRCCPLS